MEKPYFKFLTVLKLNLFIIFFHTSKDERSWVKGQRQEDPPPPPSHGLTARQKVGGYTRSTLWGGADGFLLGNRSGLQLGCAGSSAPPSLPHLGQPASKILIQNTSTNIFAGSLLLYKKWSNL